MVSVLLHLLFHFFVVHGVSLHEFLDPAGILHDLFHQSIENSIVSQSSFRLRYWSRMRRPPRDKAGVRNMSLGEGCPVEGDDPPSFEEATANLTLNHYTLIG